VAFRSDYCSSGKERRYGEKKSVLLVQTEKTNRFGQSFTSSKSWHCHLQSLPLINPCKSKNVKRDLPIRDLFTLVWTFGSGWSENNDGKRFVLDDNPRVNFYCIIRMVLFWGIGFWRVATQFYYVLRGAAVENYWWEMKALLRWGFHRSCRVANLTSLPVLFPSMMIQFFFKSLRFRVVHYRSPDWWRRTVILWSSIYRTRYYSSCRHSLKSMSTLFF